MTSVKCSLATNRAVVLALLGPLPGKLGHKM